VGVEGGRDMWCLAGTRMKGGTSGDEGGNHHGVVVLTKVAGDWLSGNFFEKETFE